MNMLSPRDVENMLGEMQKYRSGFKKKDDASYTPILDQNHSPARKKHVLVLIKRVCNSAIKRELYYGPNPADKIEPPKVNNEITECLTEAQLRSLLDTLDIWRNRLAAFVVGFSLYTGLRLDEVVGLVWQNVDRERGFIRPSLRGDPHPTTASQPSSCHGVQAL